MLPIALCLGLLLLPQDPTNQNQTKVAPASKEAELALPRFQKAPGIEAMLWAAEPLLANPVALSVDEAGRVFVAESHRIERGVFDTRNHQYWLDEDLACRTVADRIALLKKHLKEFEKYSAWHDQVRRLEDSDGDGKADRSTVFADGFNRLEDGIGSGVLARRGAVYYACIPDLVRLHDDPATGKSRQKEVLSTGYGVHVSYMGHDMHGLAVGPDQKLYFSIGDRGFAPPGFAYPDCGGVLRCDLDGKNLEVFHTGLRNPQELAFDQWGNLFTGDNNGDGGDRARLVYVTEGGDSGWRIGYQWFDDRGPWNREKLWHTPFPRQAAWIVPPLAHMASGPSGFAYYPGTGLPERYAEHFFLVDFTGGAGGSGVLAFRLQPHGAGFELGSFEKFLWGVLATDCEFGPDGALWIADWVEGWVGSGKGRIYRAFAPQAQRAPVVAQVGKLLREGLAGRPLAELLPLLGHPDRRVRQEAHFACAEHGAAACAVLVQRAQQRDDRLARVHALWALALLGQEPARVDATLLALLDDADSEIRGLCARLLGERRHQPAAAKLRGLLTDRTSRVRYHAALALGKLRDLEAVDELCALLRDNADRDVYLRHAASHALGALGAPARLLAHAQDPAAAVRIGLVLALRRCGSAALAGFLGDPDPAVVAEAARAIYDLPVEAALPELAALLSRPGLTDQAVIRRAIAAQVRLGTETSARALLAAARAPALDEAMRLEAFDALAHWARPGGRDRVTGNWRPVPAPSGALPAAEFADLGVELLGASDGLAQAAARALAQHGSERGRKRLLQVFEDGGRQTSVRTAALEALLQLGHPELDRILKRRLADADGKVRQAVMQALAKRDPAATLPALEAILRVGPIPERQEAYRTIGGIAADAADDLLLAELDRLAHPGLAAEVELDLLLALGMRKAERVRQRLAAHQAARSQGDPVGSHRECLQGGDRRRGERIFRDKKEAQCTKCHALDGKGGTAAPDLKGVAARLSREQLLEAVLAPSKVIAAGYGTVAFELKSGVVKAGLIRSEDKAQLELEVENEGRVRIDKADIESRADPVSAMPAMGGVLDQRELRDLIEYLASLK